MKITNIRTYIVDPLILTGSGRRRPLRWMFVRVDTDEGITGWGEGSSYPYHGSDMIGFGVLAARDALIGEDPTSIEPLWQKLFRRHTSVGARGIASGVVSAIDIALWDITGKAANKPVYQLLGGKMRDDIDLYANGWFDGCETPDEYAQAARDVVLAAGHTALKLSPLRQDESNLRSGGISPEAADAASDIVAAIRETVGPNHEILIDAHGNFNVPTAVRLGNRLYEESNIGWFEEPVPAESNAALKLIRPQMSVPISIGERLFTRHDFVEIFESRLADYIMPDICLAGGITEMRKIANMAEAYHIPFSPHDAMGSLQIVSGAQLCMTLPNFYRLEHSMGRIASYNRYLQEPLNFHDGKITLSDKPGLGVEMNVDEIERTAVQMEFPEALV
jgi:galactonate dehydratase